MSLLPNGWQVKITNSQLFCEKRGDTIGHCAKYSWWWRLWWLWWCCCWCSDVGMWNDDDRIDDADEALDTGDVTAVVAVVDDTTTAMGVVGSSSVRGRSRMSRTEKLLVFGILIDNSLQEGMICLKGQSHEIYVLNLLRFLWRIAISWNYIFIEL